MSIIGGKITHRYNAALLGFSAEMPDNAVRTCQPVVANDKNIHALLQRCLEANEIFFLLQ